MTGWNFAGQNLTGASLSGGTRCSSNADFTDANLWQTANFASSARSPSHNSTLPPSYRANDLHSIRLSNDDLPAGSSSHRI